MDNMPSPSTVPDSRRGSLVPVWMMAVFHTTALTTLLALVAHGAGSLGDALSGAGTAQGIILFVALGATTWWATREAIGWTFSFTGGDERPSLWRAGVAAMTWGGVNGTLFFLILVMVFVVPSLLSMESAGTLVAPGASSMEAYSGPPAPQTGRSQFFAVALLFYSVVGSVVAYVVGAIVGLVLGSIDLALTALARGIASAVASTAIASAAASTEISPSAASDEVSSQNDVIGPR